MGHDATVTTLRLNKAGFLLRRVSARMCPHMVIMVTPFQITIARHANHTYIFDTMFLDLVKQFRCTRYIGIYHIYRIDTFVLSYYILPK